MPAIGALMAVSITLQSASQGLPRGRQLRALLVIGIPVLTVLALLSGA